MIKQISEDCLKPPPTCPIYVLKKKQRQETQVSRFQTFLTTRGPMLVSQHSTDSFRPFPSTPKNMQRTAETSSHQAVAAAVKQLKRKRSDAQTSTFAHFSEEHIT